MARSAKPAAQNRRPAGGVQSIERAFGLLETMADHGGAMGLSALAAASGLPLTTIHRLLRTLVDLGYLRHEPSQQYVLAPRLIRLGEGSADKLDIWARPYLAGLVDDLGETANLAMLDGDQVLYVAQVPSRHSMRMFTEVGRRVVAHTTAVGKVMMATMSQEQVTEMLGRTGMPQRTSHSITDPAMLLEQLRWSAEHGYSLDEGEQEVGVRCVAVALPNAPKRLAISVSGPAIRMTEELVADAVPLLTRACSALANDLA